MSKAGTVLVAGTINTDLVGRVRRAPEAGETVTGSSFAIFGGGKGANQAVSCARSGGATVMLGAVGDDDFGTQRLADLRKDGIETGSVAVAAGVASGVALITVEEESGQNRIAYIPGATATVTAEAARSACEQVRPRVVLATLELPEAARVALFASAKAHGATVVVNATPEAVGARVHLPVIDVLIVNETEASDLLGYEVGPENAMAAAAGLAAMGPAAIAITLGAAGAVVLTPEGGATLPAPKVTVVDTTGAGDAFCGAVAARLAAGQSVQEAARAGVVAGSLAATKAGAQPSMPTAEEIARMLQTQAT